MPSQAGTHGAVSPDTMHTTKGNTVNYADLTQAIIDAETGVAAAEAQLSEAKKKLHNAEANLIHAIQTGMVPHDFNAHGYRWSYDSKTLVTPVDKEAVDDVVQWILRNGGKSMMKETMHAASRDKFLRETLVTDDGEAIIPDDLAAFVKTDSLPRIAKRKS